MPLRAPGACHAAGGGGGAGAAGQAGRAVRAGACQGPQRHSVLPAARGAAARMRERMRAQE